MTPAPRIGVLGGTFDPIHLGHLEVARLAVECRSFDRLLLIPARVPPHKAAAAAGAGDRLAMAELAVADMPRVEVSDLELRRAGPSYTADTLRELRAAYPQAELELVLGWDAARLLPEWKEPDQVLALASLAIFRRPGLAGPTGAELTAAGIDPARATVCEGSTPDVDATEIRRRAARGESLAGLVPASVADYIRSHALYGSSH